MLVGTVAIETSEMLSELLKRKGVPHNVLNAKQHEREAGVIAQAGRPGTVTIATNMAGRGVDILLGGNPDGMARERLRKEEVDLATLSEDDPVWLAGAGPGQGARWRPTARRCSPPAACTCWARSVTRRGASTTSCAAVPGARATRLLALLRLARRRPDAPVRRAERRGHHGTLRHGRGRADRALDLSARRSRTRRCGSKATTSTSASTCSSTTTSSTSSARSSTTSAGRS